MSKKLYFFLTIILLGIIGSILFFYNTSNIIYIIIYLSILFLLAEISLRILLAFEIKYNLDTNLSQIFRESLISPKRFSFKAHPYALYIKKKNSKGLYTTNNLGYAGTRDLSLEKDEEKIRIYCVGGSTVEDIDLTQGPNSSWPAKMQDLLNKSIGNDIVEVINAGMSGYTSAESLSEFIFRGIDLNPDILIIYHNINDAWTAQMVDGFVADYSHSRIPKAWKMHWINLLPIFSFSLFYQIIRYELVNNIGKANALIFQVSDPPWKSNEEFDSERIRTFYRNIKSLIVVAKANSIEPIIVKWEFDWNSNYIPPYFIGDQGILAKKYLKYVKANNETLSQLSSEFDLPHLNVGPFNSDCFYDKIHFNAKGLDEMALRMTKKTLPIIKDILIHKNR